MPLVNPEVFAAATKQLGKEAGKDLGSLIKDMWWSGRSILKGWGENAKKLAGIMDESDHHAGLRAGQDLAKVRGLLKGLNKEEKTHIFDVLDGQALPAHEKYGGISAQIREIYDSYAHDAIDLDLDVYRGSEYRKALKEAQAAGMDYHDATREAMEVARRPFAARENYIPHYFGEEAIQAYLKEGPRKEALLNQIINSGWADSRQSAEVFMREQLERPAEFRGGPLQHSRDNLFQVGYDRDLEAVSHRYFHTAARRLEQARRFGARDEGAYELINAIGGEEGLSRVGEKIQGAAKLYSAWAGTRDPRLSSLSRFLTPIHSVTLLSTAGLIQPSQLMNTVARIGWTNTIRAGAAIMKDWVKQEGGHAEWAVSTGATIDSIMADAQVTSLQGMSQFWMKIIGMEHLDRLNRVVSAVGGRFYADKLAKNMMKEGVEAGQYRRLFERMGLDADAIYSRGGKLTADEARSAGLHISRDTQFASSVLDLPPLRNTPEGRFMYLYKSFALQQSYFIKRELIDEIRYHHNIAPALAYGSALVTVAPLMGELVRGVKGRRREEPPQSTYDHFANWTENVLTVGSFGAYWDAGRTMGSGPEALYRYVLGPTVGEAVQFAATDVPPIFKRGDPMPLVKHIVRRTPLVGSALYNLWWPPH